jgi:SAM-dependent methyltransferase
MPRNDAERWNTRYREGYYGKAAEPRAVLEMALPNLRPNGLILDLAMGLGVNACWLVERGYRVIGVDIASAAVIPAKANCPQLMAVIADLDELVLPEQAFHAVLSFYYLNRKLLREFPRILRPGGIAIVETLKIDMRQIKPELPEVNLLQDGELKGLFSGWDILFYQEGWQPSAHGGQKSIASLIARLPG